MSKAKAEKEYVTISRMAKEVGLSINEIKCLCINHKIPHLEFKGIKDGKVVIRYKLHRERVKEALVKLETEINTNPETVPTLKKAENTSVSECLGMLKNSLRN